jgi:S1-C subfamily serine protease
MARTTRSVEMEHDPGGGVDTLIQPIEPAEQPPRDVEPRHVDASDGGNGGLRWYVAAAVALLLVVASATSFAIGRITAPEPEATAVSTTVAGAGGSTATAVEPVVAVAQALEKSVVQIDTQQGLGSGVIYDESGLILTAAHVVGSASNVVVQMYDGSKVDGTVVGADPVSDVAVVRVSAGGLVAARLAVDEDLRVGQMAIALGSPFGFDQSVTAGVVSATSRAIVDPDGVVRQLIQTDAPINPGNSGGPLANRDAAVIGINDQIISRSGGNDGVGFAIPITRAKEVADQLLNGKVIEQAFLGVSGTDPTLGEAGGLITEVVAGSPADHAGLQVGDLITGVDGTDVTSFTELAAVIRGHAPGDAVTLSVTRNGNSIEIDVTLGGN